MKTFRLLLTAQAALALALGFGLGYGYGLGFLLPAGAPRATSGDAVAATVRLLGFGFGGLGLVLAAVLLERWGTVRQRLALGLTAANLAIATIALVEQTEIWLSATGQALVLAHALLAAGFLSQGFADDDPVPARRAAAAPDLASWLALAAPLLATLAAALLAGIAGRALGLGGAAALALGAGVAVLGCLWLSRRLAQDLAAALRSLAGFLDGRALAAPPAPRTRALSSLLQTLGALTAQAGNLGEIRRRWLERVGEAAAQEERNRLARDLHDSIKQQLFSLQLGLATVAERWDADTPGARTALATVQQGVRETLAEMRSLLEQLQPQALATAGLVEALRAQCEALGYRSGAQVTLELLDPEVDDRLLPAAQETVFRIAQEALANVFRHARAEHVRVRLGRRGHELFFEVLDDGRGFDPKTAPRGMGLRNLEDRAASLGGHLRLTSRLGSGTTLSLRVPLLARVPARESPVEPALRRALWGTRLAGAAAIALLLTRLHALPHLEVWATAAVAALLATAAGVEAARRRLAAGAEPADRPRLDFTFHKLTATLAFAALAAAVPWGLWGASLPRSWWPWAGAVLVASAVGGWALVSFHRASRRRRRYGDLFARPWQRWATVAALLALAPLAGFASLFVLVSLFPFRGPVAGFGLGLTAYFVARIPREPLPEAR